ncbi:flagellar protein FlgN [Clostridium oceanicum]|uniref:Flagellar protein FlgN n=1 Tax=Clostridium oceanicum TaxID=1543 RepID=A0ABP3V1H7_9CLOT
MKNELRQILKDELSISKDLLTALENQHEFLANKKAFELDKIARDIESISKEIAKCEIERRKIVKDRKMSDVLKEINDNEIDKIYKECLNILREVKLQKDTNEILIKQGLSLTTNMLNILNPDKSPKTYSSYSSYKRR